MPKVPRPTLPRVQIPELHRVLHFLRFGGTWKNFSSRKNYAKADPYLTLAERRKRQALTTFWAFPMSGCKHAFLSVSLVVLVIANSSGISTAQSEEVGGTEAEKEQSPSQEDEEASIDEKRTEKVSQEKLKKLPDALQSAFAAYSQQDFPRVVRILDKKISSMKPVYRDFAFFLLGSSLKEMREFGKAENVLQRSLYFRARNSDALHVMAIAQYQLGKKELAITNLNEAIWFNKYQFYSPGQSHLQLAIIDLGSDNPQLAEERLRKAVSASGAPSEATSSLTDLLLKDGRREEALQLYNLKTIDWSAKPPTLLLSYARARLLSPDRELERDDIETTSSELEKLLAQEDLASSYRDRAETLYIRSLIELGERSSARSALQKAMKARPSDGYLKRLEQQIRLEENASTHESEREKLIEEAKILEREG